MGVIPLSESYCTFCGDHLETSDHLLLSCALPWQLWSWWLEIWNVKWVIPHSLKDMFIQWNLKGKGEFFSKIWHAIFYIIIWSLWKERNDRAFNNKSSSISDIQDLVLLRLSWWIGGWNSNFPYSSSEISRNPKCLMWHDSLLHSSLKSLKSPSISLWSPPKSRSLKWNVDASFDPTLNQAAVGGVLRNEAGIFLCIFSTPIPPMEINSAEIFAIYRAIKISLATPSIKNSVVTIESDSKNAVQWVMQNSGGPWNLGFILNLIRAARKRELNLSIVHKGRESNNVVDALAKQGLRRMDDFIAWC